MDLYTLFTIGHIIGTALGVGSATVSDVFFLKILRANKLTKGQFEFAHAVSWLVWAGFFILLASGVGFLVEARVSHPQLYDNPKLWAKLAIVGVIFVNGLVVHARILPLFARSIGGTLSEGGLFRHTLLLFTAAAVSIVSWYSALVLGAWRGIDYRIPYLDLMDWYLVLLGAGIVVSNIVGRYIARNFR